MGLVLRENLMTYAEYAVWKIEEDSDFYYSKLILSDWEQTYLDGIAHPKRKLTWLASRYLLKYLMGTTDFVELLFDVHGKPFISNFPLHLSLSHSPDYAAAIISRDFETGIDIEQPHRNIESLKNKFLSKTELAHIGEEERMKKLLIYWSAKEVMYKIYGKRKLEFREDMYVKPFLLNDRGDLNGILMKYGEVYDYHMHYLRHQDFVVVTGVEKEVEVISKSAGTAAD